MYGFVQISKAHDFGMSLTSFSNISRRLVFICIRSRRHKDSGKLFLFVMDYGEQGIRGRFEIHE